MGRIFNQKESTQIGSVQRTSPYDEERRPMSIDFLMIKVKFHRGVPHASIIRAIVAMSIENFTAELGPKCECRGTTLGPPCI